MTMTTPECECYVTPESQWLSAASCGYGGGYEPGSQMEWNPDCPVHPAITRPTDEDFRAYLDGEHGPPSTEAVAIIQADLLAAITDPTSPERAEMEDR